MAAWPSAPPNDLSRLALRQPPIPPSPSAYSAASPVISAIDTKAHVYPSLNGTQGMSQVANEAGSSMSPSKTPKTGGSQAQPPWAELKTKAGKDRKRLPLACMACRRKKIRCSGEKPACKHCLKSRIPCVYKVTTRKATPRTDYMAMLDKRLKRMEDRVIKIIPKEDFETAPSIARANVRPSMIPRPGPGRKRSAEEAFGFEQNRPGETATTDSKAMDTSKDIAPPPKEETEEDTDTMLMEGRDLLPDKELQAHLAEVYFEYCYGQTYSFLHKPSYMRKLDTNKLPPVLSLAVCAVASRFSEHPHEKLKKVEPAFRRGDEWARAAQDIALKRFDVPNLTILIVFLLLSMHALGMCQGGRAWMLSGMAHRMAYALRLHKDSEYDELFRGVEKGQKLGFTDREIRRRTMWACFAMDRLTSSGTERPMFASEHHMCLQLPVKEEFFQLEIPAVTEYLGEPHEKHQQPENEESTESAVARSNMGVTAYNMRLIALWGRLVKYMNLGGRLRDDYPMWSPHSNWRRLAKQVVDFKRNLPESLQFNEENLTMHAAEKTANQFVFLHIAYNQVVLFLHRFAFPNISMYTPCKGGPEDFLEESKKTAIEAASAISDLIGEGTKFKVVAPFIGYSVYMSSAVHVSCIFSGEPELQKESNKRLNVNMTYLTRMKSYWGVFCYLTANLQDLYQQYCDAGTKGKETPGDPKDTPGTVHQFGDWHDRYPKGVTQTDYEPYEPLGRKNSGNDAVMSQPSELQSVEQFFSTSPPPLALQPKTRPRKKSSANAANSNKASGKQNSTDSGPRSSNRNRENQQSTEKKPSLQESPALPESYERRMVTEQPMMTHATNDMHPNTNPTAQIGEGVMSHSFGSNPPLDPRLASMPPQEMHPNMEVPVSRNPGWPTATGGIGDSFLDGEPANAWFLPYNLGVPTYENGMFPDVLPPNMAHPQPGMWFPTNNEAFPGQGMDGNFHHGHG
ncbi:MAG: hypothetical protein M1831_000115 [Alyxoria varia]|nr:MAG: hypothetical protein M1831_000115 [Alyxoria varia]